jgi:hypothetical protein
MPRSIGLKKKVEETGLSALRYLWRSNGQCGVIVGEHPLFPEWLAAFEHLVKAHARVKGGGDAPVTPELQQEFAAAKAAYLDLATKLD